MIRSHQTGGLSPGAVLRLAIVGWGLGDLALGRRRAGLAWLLAELVALLALAYAVIGLASSTWYVIPFLGGVGFLAAWALQAVGAYGRARHRGGAIGPTPASSPAAAIAWLSLPLLLWGTGFWLVSASAASPAAVLDRFEASWPEAARGEAAFAPDLAEDRSALVVAARTSLRELEDQCRAGELNADCAEAAANLLRDVRLTIANESGDAATAVAEVVSYERRAATFLGFIAGTQLVPVVQRRILELELRAVPAALPGGVEIGARRWQIVNARALPEVPST